MATKQTKSVTDKKVSVPTKQVSKKAPAPAKTAPVKPVKVKVYGVKETPKGIVPSDRTVKLNKTDSKAFHAAKTPQEQAKVIGKAVLKDKGPAGAAARKLADQAVKQAKAKADIAAAKANLAKAKVKQADANAKLKKADADIKAAKGTAKVATKAAAPVKKTINKLDAAIKNSGSDTKGYKVATAAEQKAFETKRGVVVPKAPAGKSNKVTPNALSVGVKASSRPKQTNKDNATSTTSVDIKSIVPSVLATAPAVIPPASELAKQAAQAAKPPLPSMMSAESAIKREELLRRSFGTLIAGAAR